VKTLKELIAAGEKILAEADALREKKAPDAEIQSKCAEFDAVQSDIEQVRTDAKRRNALAEAAKDAEIVQAGDLAGAAQAKDHEADARAKEAGFWAYMNGDTVSDRMRDALRPTSPKFQASKSDVAMPERMAAKILGHRAYNAVAGKSLPDGSGTFQSSGFVTGSNILTVPPTDFRAMLLELPPEPPHVLDMATVVPCPYGHVMWPRLSQTDANEYGGVTGQWIQEGAYKPDTEANVDQVNINTYEYAAYTEITNRLLARSAVQLEPLLTRLFRDKVMDALDRAFLTGGGDAVGQPEGIVTNTDVRLVDRNVAGVFGWVDSTNLLHALRVQHRPKASWVLGDDALRSAELEVDKYGRPLFLPGVALTSPDTIRGKPYIPTHRLPAVGYRGDVILGDFSQYIVPMEHEVIVMRSEHYKFKNNVTAFRVSVVVGGKAVEPRAFAILDTIVGSTTNSAAAATTTAPPPTTTSGY
jgi:HK97 family phage major capsid protein